MSALLAIDPGTTQSGWVVFEDDRVKTCGIDDNRDMLARVRHHGGPMAIEVVAGMGMTVGRETFETCEWIGRFRQAYRDPDAVKRIYRRDVKLHLCGNSRAKDPNIRQAILDMFPRTGGGATPQVGTAKKPGPLFGVKSHIWSALAVAMTALDRHPPKCYEKWE